MIRYSAFGFLAALGTLASSPAVAQIGRPSTTRQAQERGTAQIPTCARRLGSIALVEPDVQWWSRYGLENPEAILRVFVQRSGCFTLVNRGRAMRSRAMERELETSGELQAGSRMGAGQVRTADYLLEPNIVSANNNSGGGGVGGAVAGVLGRVGGGLGRLVGGAAGGIDIRRGEANVTLSVVDTRSTEEVALAEGLGRKRDLSFRGGGALGSLFGGFGGAGMSSYQNTEIGQVIVFAYLDAYAKLVGQLGGAPTYAPASAPASAGATTSGSQSYAGANMSQPVAITAGLFGSVRLGSSLGEIERLLGGPGDEQNATRVGSRTVRTLLWQRGERAILGTFDNDRLTSKSKIGF
jgi:curli biogenesis system outer membrane secretion channel CsgG